MWLQKIGSRRYNNIPTDAELLKIIHELIILMKL